MEILKFGFSFFGVNTYLVYDAATRECVVVDPGMVNRYEEAAIKRAVEKYALKITKVINTCGRQPLYNERIWCAGVCSS